MTRMSAKERRALLGNSRDNSLKRFDDIFPDDLKAASFRPRLANAPLVPSFSKRCTSSPWEDPLPLVREESMQELFAEERHKPTVDLCRRHSWNLGIVPAEVSYRLKPIPLRLRSDSRGSSCSSMSSLADVEEDELEEDSSDNSDAANTCSACGTTIPTLDRNLNFIEDSLNEDSASSTNDSSPNNSTAATSNTCRTCKLAQESVKHRNNSVSRSPPSQAEVWRQAFADYGPIRHASLSDSFDLPSISEPEEDEELDSIDSKEMQELVQNEMEKLMRYNRSNAIVRRSTIGCSDDFKKSAKSRRRFRQKSLQII